MSKATKYNMQKVQSVKQGTLYMSIGTGIVAFIGYIIHAGLGRLLTVSEYGTYYIVTSFMAICIVILSSGIPRSVSKFISERNNNAIVITKTALKIQLILAIFLAIIVFVFAEKVAYLLNDITLLPYIQLVTILIPIEAAFSLLSSGTFNGIRKYNLQTISGVTYSVSKAIFIFLLVFMGLKVFGALLGIIIGTIISLVVAYFLFRNLKLKNIVKTNKISHKKLINYAIPITVFSIMISISGNIDVYSVKSICGSQLTGIYTAVAMISRLPVLLVNTLCITLFPAMSNVSYNNNINAIKSYITKTFTYSLIFLVLSAAFIAMFASQLISFVYTDKYIIGAEILGILGISMIFYSLFSLFTTIINASNKPTVSTIISFFVLCLLIALNQLLIPKYQLIGAAYSTGIGFFIGTLISGGYVWKKWMSKN